MSLIEIVVLFLYACIIVFVISVIIIKSVKNSGNKLVFQLMNFLVLPSLALTIINKQNYTRTGWTAIGDFDFKLSSYIFAVTNYSTIVTLLVLVYMALNAFFLKTEKVMHLNSKPLRKRRNISLTFFLLSMLFLSYYMASNFQIGITGAQPQQLPYKFAGISYYTMRVILPFILFYHLYKFRIGTTTFLIIVSAIILISITTMSKYQCAVLIFAVLITSVKDKQYFRSSVVFIIGVLLLQVIPLLRQLKLVVIDGRSTLQGLNIIETMEAAVSYLNLQEIWFVFLAIASRILSLKNTILAMQVNDVHSIPLLNFIPVISYFGNQGHEVTYLIYGFYPADGFATGVDNIGLLVIGMHNWPLLFIASLIALCCVFKIHERLAFIITNDNFLSASIVFTLGIGFLILPPMVWFFMLTLVFSLSFLKRLRWRQADKDQLTKSL